MMAFFWKSFAIKYFKKTRKNTCVLCFFSVFYDYLCHFLRKNAKKGARIAIKHIGTDFSTDFTSQKQVLECCIDICCIFECFHWYFPLKSLVFHKTPTFVKGRYQWKHAKIQQMSIQHSKLCFYDVKSRNIGSDMFYDDTDTFLGIFTQKTT